MNKFKKKVKSKFKTLHRQLIKGEFRGSDWLYFAPSRHHPRVNDARKHESRNGIFTGMFFSLIQTALTLLVLIYLALVMTVDIYAIIIISPLVIIAGYVLVHSLVAIRFYASELKKRS